LLAVGHARKLLTCRQLIHSGEILARLAGCLAGDVTGQLGAAELKAGEGTNCYRWRGGRSRKQRTRPSIAIGGSQLTAVHLLALLIGHLLLDRQCSSWMRAASRQRGNMCVNANANANASARRLRVLGGPIERALSR